MAECVGPAIFREQVFLPLLIMEGKLTDDLKYSLEKQLIIIIIMIMIITIIIIIIIISEFATL